MPWEPGPRKPLWRSLRRGFLLRCPRCGHGRLFTRYLKSAESCSACGEALHHHRADDAPPYFTILIVGHAVIPAVLWVEMAMAPPLWLQALVWLPSALVACLLFLQPVKGALIGLQWALSMHGFGGKEEEGGELP